MGNRCTFELEVIAGTHYRPAGPAQPGESAHGLLRRAGVISQVPAAEESEALIAVTPVKDKQAVVNAFGDSSA